MRRILGDGAVIKNDQSKGKPILPSLQREDGQVRVYERNHDLHHFRHMLAGPIGNEAQLDKFCDKKGGLIVADIKYDG